MTDKEVKLAIQSAIKSLAAGSLTGQSISFFNTLGYKTERQNPFTHKTFAFFKESFLDRDSSFNEEKALVKEWKSVDLLFQLTKDEVSDMVSLFDTNKVDNTIIETYLFFALELKNPEYTRTALAQITREINKVFPMPVMLLFKHGEHLTLSIINRRLHKKDEQKDVLEKVTLIKDISIENPHRAHIEILFDLSFNELKRIHKFTNFVELHNAWQKTLDTKELNKRFYRELSNWYFWALNNVSFPNDIDDDKDDTVFNSESIIRLLTRLIFIWFIKEKNLIPEKIFEEKEVSKLIKGFNTKGSTVYYRAILQNLFFATLNQKIEERVFATDGAFKENKKNYGIKNLYRYSSDFAISKDEVIKLFEGVPFLNGGLFDCLDSEDKNGKVIYLDGFSRNSKKQAHVPDELFFSKEKTIDLSDVYDDKKKKNETVKGLFEIFKQYKFTVTENTPIEEEIALDPELLGRVFENLLASYNPETKTTARKQTGSFYTPREIVNYMVDESLKAYLKQKLETEAGMKQDDAEVGLEFLLGYNEKEHLFNEKQTAVLINAIDSCKILDPACGSGAFPMGILHKLVHILHNIDPKNKRWQERQIKKAMAIDDTKIRDNSISDIETAFNNNELDYGRKLYLIENCIYGVDIQPIATQISKLRFFISLIVDQKADKARDNFGIRPLPNLETKFVAANTLIGIEKPKAQGSLFEDKKVQSLEEKLKDVRHRLFSAKTPANKRKLREEDQKLREEMGALLKNAGWSNDTARQLAGWDPYNQNASSPFFDPKWMFGITNGFDVVIGNPPYDVYQGYRKDEIEVVKKLSIYEISKGGKLNAYKLFLAKSSELMSKKGITCQIFQNSFLGDLSAMQIRLHYLSQHSISFIDSFPERDDTNKRVFPGVKMSTCIMLAASNPVKNNRFRLNVYSDRQFTLRSSIDYTFNDIKEIDPGYYTILSIDEKEKSTVKAISLKKRIKDFGKCYEGEINLTFHKKYLSLTRKAGYAPMIKGAGVQQYYLAKNMSQGAIEWVDKEKFLEDNSGPKTRHHTQERLILQGITEVDESKRLKMALLPKGTFCGNSVNYILFDNKNLKIEYFLALLNSSALNWYFKKFSTNSNVNGYEVDNLPIVIDEKKSGLIVQLVNVLMYLKYKEQKETSEITKSFHKIINATVNELYFPDEIKAANAEVLKHLTNLPELKDDWSDEKKLKVIEKVYKELSDPKHPVSIAMERQKTVQEVRIIEGLDK